jgi:hypothetical protein
MNNGHKGVKAEKMLLPVVKIKEQKRVICFFIIQKINKIFFYSITVLIKNHKSNK